MPGTQPNPNPRSESDEFARLLLDELGLPSAPLEPVRGWSNHVWLAPSHAVRVSSGRFRGAFAHECRVISLLPASIPHAPVHAYGQIGDREWLVQQRVKGKTLLNVWPDLTHAQQRSATGQLADALRQLHQMDLPTGFTNPCLDDALSPGGDLRNAYHASPHEYQKLIEEAGSVPGVDKRFLDSVREFVENRLDAFADDEMVLVHGDIHFSNLIYDGDRLTAILDFEGVRPAPADQELDTLLRQLREPELYLPPGAAKTLSATDLTEFVETFESRYPELFSHPRLIDRLKIYDVMWHLVQLLHFPPGSGPPDPYGHLQTLVKFDRFQR